MTQPAPAPSGVPQQPAAAQDTVTTIPSGPAVSGGAELDIQQTPEQAQLTRQMNARFSVVRLPDGSKPGTSAPVQEAAPTPVTQPAPETPPQLTG